MGIHEHTCNRVRLPKTHSQVSNAYIRHTLASKENKLNLYTGLELQERSLPALHTLAPSLARCTLGLCVQEFSISLTQVFPTHPMRQLLCRHNMGQESHAGLVTSRGGSCEQLWRTREKCVWTDRQSTLGQKPSNWLDGRWIPYIPLWPCAAPI